MGVLLIVSFHCGKPFTKAKFPPSLLFFFLGAPFSRRPKRRSTRHLDPPPLLLPPPAKDRVRDLNTAGES